MRWWVVAVVSCSACAKPSPVHHAPSFPRAVAPSSSTADATAPASSCDQLVAQIRASGGVGMMGGSNPSADPICDWRVDDANHDAMAETAGASSAEPTAVSGRLDVAKVSPALRKVTPAIVKCAGGEPLRARFTVAQNGNVPVLLLDYRRTFPDAVAPCVQRVLKSAKLPRPQDPTATVTWTFAPSSVQTATR